ncbi:MAG: nucleoside-diphosphate kinase [Limnochordia bacterium]
MERTFVIVKPEAVKRGLIGEILRRFEQKGLRITNLKMTTISEDLARVHYGHHADKPFFPALMKAITAEPVAMAILEGPDCIRHVRNLIGATNPLEAAPGSIRGDFALANPYNMVHAADSPEAAELEIERFFGEQ